MSKSKAPISEHAQHLSLEQMQEYLEDKLPVTGMHQVERHLLDCELCSDALEGLSVLPQETNLADNITHLKYKIRKKSLRDPIVRKKKKLVPLLWKPVSVAAAIIILISGTFILLRIDKQPKKTGQEISLVAPKKVDKIVPQSDVTREKAIASPIEESIAMNTKSDNASAKPASTPQSLLQSSAPAIEAEEILQEGITDTESLIISPATAPEPEDKKDNKQAIPLISAPKSTADHNLGVPSTGVNTRSASGISQRLISISGKVVTAEDELPLAGVNVLIKGTDKGITTDSQGNYNLLAPADGILVFNFIGMQTEEIAIKNLPQIDVRLQSDLQALNEVAVTGYSKKKNNGTNYPYQRPEPTSGFADYKKYIKYQLRYPKEARKNRIEGFVRIEFEVQPNGELSDFNIKKGLGFGCDEEAIRLLKEGPLWKAAELNGEPVKRKVNMSIPFKL